MSVPQEGGEYGQTLFDIDASAIPVEESGHREVMPEIVKPRSGAVSQVAESDLPGELNERPPDHAIGQRPSLVGKEEARGGWLRKMVVPELTVATEHCDSGRMEWHQAGLAELGEADRQERLHQVNVRSVKANHFADPHTGHCQKAEDSVIRPWPGASAR